MKDGIFTDSSSDNSNNGRVLPLVVEGKRFEWPEQYITGAKIKKIAGLSSESELFLSIEEPWKDEMVGNDADIDLARPGIEYFYLRQKLKLTIDGKEFEWPKQYITGKEIKAIAGIPAESLLFLSIKGPWEDEAIEDVTKVDLAREGIEHFYSKAVPKHVFNFFVDKKEYFTEKTVLTARAILVDFVKVDATKVDDGSKTLVLKSSLLEYTDPATEITLIDCMEFTIYDNSKTTVS